MAILKLRNSSFWFWQCRIHMRRRLSVLLCDNDTNSVASKFGSRSCPDVSFMFHLLNTQNWHELSELLDEIAKYFTVVAFDGADESHEEVISSLFRLFYDNSSSDTKRGIIRCFMAIVGNKKTSYLEVLNFDFISMFQPHLSDIDDEIFHESLAFLYIFVKKNKMISNLVLQRIGWPIFIDIMRTMDNHDVEKKSIILKIICTLLVSEKNHLYEVIKDIFTHISLIIAECNPILTYFCLNIVLCDFLQSRAYHYLLDECGITNYLNILLESQYKDCIIASLKVIRCLFASNTNTDSINTPQIAILMKSEQIAIASAAMSCIIIFLSNNPQSLYPLVELSVIESSLAILKEGHYANKQSCVLLFHTIITKASEDILDRVLSIDLIKELLPCIPSIENTYKIKVLEILLILFDAESTFESAQGVRATFIAQGGLEIVAELSNSNETQISEAAIAIINHCQ